MTDLEGRTALVTGSTSGIGRATAIALAARGAHALVVGRDEQRAKGVIAEFAVRDPDLYREKYAANAGKTAKEYGAEALANSNWELLHGVGSLTSGALMRFPDQETAIKWYNSPEYQQLIEIRGAAMDARFSLLDGLPTPTADERESE